MAGARLTPFFHRITTLDSKGVQSRIFAITFTIIFSLRAGIPMIAWKRERLHEPGPEPTPNVLQYSRQFGDHF